MNLGLTSKAVKRLIFWLIRPMDFKSLDPKFEDTLWRFL